MNVAGRKIVGSTSTPVSAGRERLERRLDVARHLQRVALGLLLDDEQQPRPVVDDGVADRRRDPSTTSATSPSRRSESPRQARSGGARSPSGRGRRRSAPASVCATAMPLVRRIDEAAGGDRRRVARRGDRRRAATTPLARSRSGSTSTWNCRSRWPQIATLATPGIAISRGRIVQRASVVSSICESVFDDMPIFITRLSDDSGDRMTGGRATAGSVAATRASRSCTSCRAGMRSVPLEDQHDRRQPEHRLRAQRLRARARRSARPRAAR